MKLAKQLCRITGIDIRAAARFASVHDEQGNLLEWYWVHQPGLLTFHERSKKVCVHGKEPAYWPTGAVCIRNEKELVDSADVLL